ncbi:MAG TPA: FAD-dependent monooxygenase [Casimicrobiaceae bacterium]|nr:FAD-dependent monooxygenase [Casimicrobiaceae bacterium]
MHDLAIVGAGPVGATLACALARAGLDLAVLDARAAGATPRGDRSLALSHGARLVFERLGVWQALEARSRAVTPIVAIDVSQARGFGSTRLAAADVGLPALGYVVSYVALQETLDAAVRTAGIAVTWAQPVARVRTTPMAASVELADGGGELTVRLAVVADGGGDNIEGIARVRRAYGQVALIADVVRDAPADGVAFERFTAQGPVALLPKGDGYGLVWTMTPARAEAALALDDRAFIAALAAHAGTRIGRIVGVGPRRTFPLALEYAKPAALPHVATLGNAAQTLHPVAGQGFNMGLRDASDLARIVIDTPRAAIGERAMIERYLRARRADRAAGIAVTHGLTRLFASERALLAWPRGAGLALLDMLPPARRAFTRAMLFGTH